MENDIPANTKITIEEGAFRITAEMDHTGGDITDLLDIFHRTYIALGFSNYGELTLADEDDKGDK